MFCTQCGTKLDDTARFCTACGRPTATEPQPAAQSYGYPAGTGMYAQAEPLSAAPPFADTKRLRKIRANKKIAGVCAGFAEFFDMDVTLMRVIWIGLLLLPPHIGAIGYLVCMLVLPKA